MLYSEFVRGRIDAALLLTNALVCSLSPIYQENGGQEQEVTVPLFTMLHSTSSTILTLLSDEMALPDADVLLRSVMEGTVKYCYLLNGTPEEREEKYTEYRYILHTMEMITDHRKSLETLQIFEEFAIDHSKIPFESNIMSEEVIEAFYARYPKGERDRIKSKWTYQGMLRSLAEAKPEYRAQLGSLSTYADTSHYAHFDWTGLSTRQSRLKCNVTNEFNYDIVHAARIISNVLCLAMFRVWEYGNVYKKSTQETYRILGDMANEVKELDLIANDIFSTS